MKTDTERLRLQEIRFHGLKFNKAGCVVGDGDYSRSIFDPEYYKPISQIIKERTADNRYDMCEFFQLHYQSDYDDITLEYTANGHRIAIYENDFDIHDKWPEGNNNKRLDLNKTLGEILYLDDNWNFES